MKQILVGLFSMSIIVFLIVEVGMYLLRYEVEEVLCDICSDGDCEGCSGS